MLGPTSPVLRDALSGQSLLTLLALVGTKRLDVESLCGRTKLAPAAFGEFLVWFQREHLVDVVSSLDGDGVEEIGELTEMGEEVPLGLLESTCELPELR